MRSVLLASASLVRARSMFGPLPTEKQRAFAQDEVMAEHFSKLPRARLSDAIDDPYYGIKTCGRRGAAARLDMQMEAFESTPLGQRKRAGRRRGNPFTYRVRREAYTAALVQTSKFYRNPAAAQRAAWSIARNVPLPPKPSKAKRTT